jgi:basic membrane lipoprotein Med (substrate-binding protein (PBP1-ABC) superfamily)
MNLSIRLSLLFAIAAALIGDAGAAEFKLKGPIKAAWIYLNAKNDGGWQQAIDEARLKIEKDLNLSIPFVESVPDEAAKITPAAERYIQRGYNVILGSSFGYSDAFKALAEKHPDVAFIDVSGTQHGPNLGSVYGRTYESQYLCGMAAGAMSKSGKIGFVAAHPLGLVNWTINAYALGAQAVNPNAVVYAVFTGAWDDPIKERAAAKALIDQGAEVLGQNIDTATTQIVAQERGVYGTGHNRDLREFAPKATLCSSVWVWDRFFEPELKKIASGTWTPNPYGNFPGIAGGGTDIACCNGALPEAVADRIKAARAEIVAGKQIFKGPLLDRDGKERVAAGQVPSDGDLWKMDWYVKGVVTQN